MSKHRPPQLPLRILRFFCAQHRIEELEGDLYEEFLENLESKGHRKASRRYTWTILRSFRYYIFDYQPRQYKLSYLGMMLRHYLKIAFRGILKNRSFTIINLLGLSLGLASALILFVFIYNQSLKDSHITDIDHYVRIESFTELRAEDGFNARVHPGVGPALQENLPQVLGFVRTNGITLDVTLPEEGFQDNLVRERFLIVDSSFFQFFEQQFIAGNAETALSDPNSIVLTESMARRLFDTDNPIGREIKTSQTHRGPAFVTAVVKDPGPNSSIQFSFLIPTDFNYGLNSGGFSPTATYLKLSPDTDLKAMTNSINKTIAPLVTGDYMKSFRYRLSKFQEVKYDLSATDNVVIPADKHLILIFTLVAGFILLLAVVNYINLSTSKALQRAKEAGIRKIIGAGRSSFFLQFVTESVFFCLIAFPIALLIFKATKPYFELALDTTMTIDIDNPTVFSLSLGFVLLTGLFAGIYPALLISRFRFHEFLKGSIFNGQKGAWLRKVLVVFQFTISIVLIICTTIVQQQLQFFQEREFSYNPEQILMLERGLSSDFDLLKTELAEISGVTKIALSTSPPGGDNFRSSKPIDGLGALVYSHDIDHDYAELLNLEFVRGENFDPSKTAENDETVIINETLANLLISSNPKQLKAPLEGKYQFRFIDKGIKGVVKDFHIQSMHEKIKPMVFLYETFEIYSGSRVMLKVNTENLTSTLEQIEELWYKHVPNTAFRYTFLDQRFEQLYTTEMRLGRVFNAFTGIAIFISCLGLFGLSMHMAQVKTKEVGIRKVLGASMAQIMRLLSAQVYTLIAIAALIATPLAWYFMDQWLQDFAYKQSVSANIFVFTLIACLTLATLTTSWHTLKAARTNPAETLRNE